MPRTSRTLVYAPQIQVLIATSQGVLDVSDDVAQGQVRRIVNGVSQFACVLNNRNRKYMGVLKRMDRITVSMTRIGKWVQVFSGYLDSVPALTLYDGSCQIRASCTIKILQNTWWDPGLPESANLLRQTNYTSSLVGTNGPLDSGMGAMLAEVLFQVGGWSKDMIKIQNIPSGFMNLAFKVSEIGSDPDAINKLKLLLGIPADSTSTSPVANNANNSPVPTATQPHLNPAPPNAAHGYNENDIATIARAAGFLGDSLVNATIIGQNNPNPLNSAGYFPFFFQDPFPVITDNNQLTAAQKFYTATKGGKDFAPFASIMAKAPPSETTKAKVAIAKPDTGVISYTVPTSTSTTSANTGSLGGQASAAGIPGVTTNSSGGTTVPTYTLLASQGDLQKIYGNTKDAIQANIVAVSFQGQTIQVHKYMVNTITTIDSQLTALKSGFVATTVTGFNYVNAPTNVGEHGGQGGLDWSAYGITLSIYGPNGQDIPASWLAVFKKNNFDVSNTAELRWLGGGTISSSPTPASGGAAGSGGVSSIVSSGNTFMNNVFNYLYAGQTLNAESVLYTGDLAPVNDVQLLATIQGIVSASLRQFQSGPDGSFIAFYPDYFGVAGNSPKMTIEDVEIMDFSIDISDDNLTTDVFVAGGTASQFNPVVGSAQWFTTQGVVNIRQKEAMTFLLGQDITDDPDLSPAAIYSRFGMRPLKQEFPQIASGLMERLQALTVFQQKWAQQFSTNVSFTFMPEIYPGMRILIKSQQVVVYVEEVTHSFGYDTGFSTSATISSPATVGGGVKGMDLGRL